MLENAGPRFLTSIIVRRFQIEPALLGFDLGKSFPPPFNSQTLRWFARCGKRNLERERKKELTGTGKGAIIQALKAGRLLT